MIISLSGFRGSGKDTAADYLVKQYGFVRLPWAAPLKDVVSILFGWDRTKLNGSTPEDRLWRAQPDTYWEEKLDWFNNPASKRKELSRFTPLVALQYVGTDLFRDMISPNFWVAINERHFSSHDRIVITDTRFPQEIQAIKSHPDHTGHCLEVHRNPTPPFFYTVEMINRMSKSEADKQAALLDISIKYNIHKSELEWIGNTDRILANVGSTTDLHLNLDAFMATNM